MQIDITKNMCMWGGARVRYLGLSGQEDSIVLGLGEKKKDSIIILHRLAQESFVASCYSTAHAWHLWIPN